MAPPFRLEVIKYHPNANRAPKMLHCKKEYDKKVKVTDWDMNLEYQPIDTNPYNPKCYRLHNSHYDRLGSQGEACLISETHESLRNGVTKSTAFQYDPHKYLVNFYTYHDDTVCEQQRKSCSKICAEYMTTMQSSYEHPYPCEIKRLVMPIVGNQNKHMAATEECKFLDDNFRVFTKTLQDVKGFRHDSFNPCTGMNTML